MFSILVAIYELPNPGAGGRMYRERIHPSHSATSSDGGDSSVGVRTSDMAV